MERSTMRVELNLPRDLLSVLNATEESVESKLRTLIALELFREERISTGKAAELIGMSKSGFIELLGSHGISYFTETPEELEAQVKAMEEALDNVS